jgi:hypothetical protein
VNKQAQQNAPTETTTIGGLMREKKPTLVLNRSVNTLGLAPRGANAHEPVRLVTVEAVRA